MSPPHPAPPRLVKIIVISDYICSFCWVVNKSLYDAIDACRDLPIRFDVEFRPFTLLHPASSYAVDPNKPMSRRAYYAKKFGEEQATAKWKFVSDMARKAGLNMAEDGVVSRSVKAHRLAAKAYQVGGQAMQRHLNTLVFDASFAACENIDSDDFLADVAVKVGLMNRDRAIEFLRSTEALDCVEKMVEAAKANGIAGVPFIIVDGKWGLNGVQPVECYIQVFRKLAQSPLYSSTSPTRSYNGCKDPIIAPALSVQ